MKVIAKIIVHYYQIWLTITITVGCQYLAVRGVQDHVPRPKWHRDLGQKIMNRPVLSLTKNLNTYYFQSDVGESGSAIFKYYDIFNTLNGWFLRKSAFFFVFNTFKGAAILVTKVGPQRQEQRRKQEK